MKKNKKAIYLILAIIVVWCPLFMGAWDKDKPASTTSLRSSNPEILANWSALETSLDAEHDFGSSTQTGSHTPGSARAFIQDDEPTTQIDGGSFAATDLGSLWFDTNSSIDNAFYVLTATTPTWTPVSTEIIATLLASNRTFAGTLTSTGNFTVGSSKVVVTATSGNTAVAGTLDVTGNIDPTTYETTNGGFLDEDAMGSDSATKVASQQSIKAYVTSQVPTSGFWTTDGSTVFNTTLTAANTFQDLDLSSYVGANDAICFFQVTQTGGGAGGTFVMKPKGIGGTVGQHIAVGGAGSISLTGGYFGYIWCSTDSSGIVQIGGAFNTNANPIILIGYIK